MQPRRLTFAGRAADRLDRDHLADHDPLDRAAQDLEAFDLGCREREPIGNGLGRNIREVHELANPIQ